MSSLVETDPEVMGSRNDYLQIENEVLDVVESCFNRGILTDCSLNALICLDEE